MPSYFTFLFNFIHKFHKKTVVLYDSIQSISMYQISEKQTNIEIGTKFISIGFHVIRFPSSNIIKELLHRQKLFINNSCVSALIY